MNQALEAISVQPSQVPHPSYAFDIPFPSMDVILPSVSSLVTILALPQFSFEGMVSPPTRLITPEATEPPAVSHLVDFTPSMSQSSLWTPSPLAGTLPTPEASTFPQVSQSTEFRTEVSGTPMVTPSTNLIETPAPSTALTISKTPQFTVEASAAVTPIPTPSIDYTLPPTAEASATPTVETSATPQLPDSSQRPKELKFRHSVAPSIEVPSTPQPTKTREVESSPDVSEQPKPSAEESTPPSVKPSAERSAPPTMEPSTPPGISPNLPHTPEGSATPAALPSPEPSISNDATQHPRSTAEYSATPSGTPLVDPSTSSTPGVSRTPGATEATAAPPSPDSTVQSTPSREPTETAKATATPAAVSEAPDTSSMPEPSKNAVETPAPAPETSTQSPQPSVPIECTSKEIPLTDADTLTKTNNFQRISLTIQIAGLNITNSCKVTDISWNRFVNLSAANTLSSAKLWYLTGISDGPEVTTGMNSTLVAIDETANTTDGGSTPTPSPSSTPTNENVLYEGSAVLTAVAFMNGLSVQLVEGAYRDYVNTLEIVRTMKELGDTDVEWTRMLGSVNVLDEKEEDEDEWITPSKVTVGATAAAITVGVATAVGTAGFVLFDAGLMIAG